MTAIPSPREKLRVLLTGAAGRIGQAMLKPMQELYELRTFDRASVPGDPGAVIGNLADRAALAKAMERIEVVLHLAANPHYWAQFDELLESNIIGAANLLEEACAAKVRRVVFASSIHAVYGYPPEHTVTAADLPRPKNLYGVSKVFGEALGRCYHDQRGLEFIALRIGHFAEYDAKRMKRPGEHRRIWLSPGDALRLFRCAIEKAGVGYAVVGATSRTEFEYLSLTPAKELLGYEPRDEAGPVGDSPPSCRAS